jgi:hypothetical protein
MCVSISPIVPPECRAAAALHAQRQGSLQIGWQQNGRAEALVAERLAVNRAAELGLGLVADRARAADRLVQRE